MYFGDALYTTLAKKFMAGGGPDPHLAAVLRYWHGQDPGAVERAARKGGVSVDELLTGSPEAAMRAISMSEDPLRRVAEFFADPEHLRRIATMRRISPRTQETFRALGLEQMLREAQTIDVLRSTPQTRDVAHWILGLYGFVQVESYWEGRNGVSATRFDDFELLTCGQTVPSFQDYALIERYTRGTDEAAITLHHLTRAMAEEGTYQAYTLLSNTRLADLPERTMEELRLLPRPERKALLERGGFAIRANDRSLDYNLLDLLEAIGGRSDDPERRYFLLRAAGLHPELEERDDLDRQHDRAQEEYIKLQTRRLAPLHDTWEPPAVWDVLLGSHGRVSVDVTPYLPLLRAENARRLMGIKSLGNLWHERITYAIQARMEHMVGVVHVAGEMCSRMGITGRDRRKVERHALTHDWGHLTGSHATEEYFGMLSGFDHEEFGLELLREDLKLLDGDPDEVIALFEHRDPLHKIVDGPFGADRIYYLATDPVECGERSSYDPLDILPWLSWRNNEVVVDEMPQAAFDFLNFRALQYERLYFSPQTQIADAYQRKMLWKAGLRDVREKIRLKNHDKIHFVPPEGMDLEFWRFNDTLLQYYFCHHPDTGVREIMRHLIAVYNKAPHATVAAVRLPGQAGAEPAAELPVYAWMKYVKAMPATEEVSAEALASYYQFWRHPQGQHRLESLIAERTGLPERHIVVAAVPNLKKLASEHAPVRQGRDVISLFDIDQEYRRPFEERVQRMACIRVAVHPQLYPAAREFFDRHSLAQMLREGCR